MIASRSPWPNSSTSAQTRPHPPPSHSTHESRLHRRDRACRGHPGRDPARPGPRPRRSAGAGRLRGPEPDRPVSAIRLHRDADGVPLHRRLRPRRHRRVRRTWCEPLRGRRPRVGLQPGALGTPGDLRRVRRRARGLPLPDPRKRFGPRRRRDGPGGNHGAHRPLPVRPDRPGGIGVRPGRQRGRGLDGRAGGEGRRGSRRHLGRQRGARGPLPRPRGRPRAQLQDRRRAGGRSGSSPPKEWTSGSRPSASRTSRSPSPCSAREAG